MDSLRILLADDHAITREGTRRLLEGHPGVEVVAEAADGQDAVRLTRELRPDILLLDIAMPRLDGVQVAQALRRELPQVRLVVLTGYASDQYALALIRLGIQGLLSKTASSEELIRAVRTVQAGRRYFQPEVAGVLHTAAAAPGGWDGPTLKEMEVLRLVAHGLKNRDIARELSCAERTVRFHLENLFSKLQATSRTDLVHRAHKKGWLP